MIGLNGLFFLSAIFIAKFTEYIMGIHNYVIFTILFKGDKKMAKEFIDFKEQYDDMMKWATKKVGYVLQEQDNLDLDELYGMATTALKKAMDLSNAAMKLVEYQTNCLEKIKLETAKVAGEREAIMRYLGHLDTKLDGLDNKLNKIEEKVKVNLNGVYGTKEKKDK